MRKIFVCLLLFFFVFSLTQAVQAEVKKKKSGTVTFDIALKVDAKAKQAKLFLPYPISDANQDISNVMIKGNFDNQAVYRDPKTGSLYLRADWAKVSTTPKLTLSFHVDSHYMKGETLPASTAAIPSDFKPYLTGNDFLPVEHKEVQRCAKEATEGKTNLLAKARAVYEWTIKHTFRDPDVRGCGLGDAIQTLTKAHGGGKCADISSVFITVARAAGIPARDVYGLRIPGKNGAITGDFHCWTEFYLPNKGWVMADPADVRKAMLIEKLDIKDPKTKEYTEFFWNGDDLFRIALNRSEHGVHLSGMQNDPIGYFMYPYAEVDGKALDYLAPKDFAYTVTFTAD